MICFGRFYVGFRHLRLGLELRKVVAFVDGLVVF